MIIIAVLLLFIVLIMHEQNEIFPMKKAHELRNIEWNSEANETQFYSTEIDNAYNSNDYSSCVYVFYIIRSINSRCNIINSQPKFTLNRFIKRSK